jgi:hypothetical protein
MGSIGTVRCTITTWTLLLGLKFKFLILNLVSFDHCWSHCIHHIFLKFGRACFPICTADWKVDRTATNEKGTIHAANGMGSIRTVRRAVTTRSLLLGLKLDLWCLFGTATHFAAGHAAMSII